MATSDRTISKPIVNILTKAQYQGISSPSADEFYLITDDAAVSAGTGISVNSAGGETIVSLDSSYAITSSDITTGTDTTNKLVSAKTIADVLGNAGNGLEKSYSNTTSYGSVEGKAEWFSNEDDGELYTGLGLSTEFTDSQSGVVTSLISVENSGAYIYSRNNNNKMSGMDMTPTGMQFYSNGYLVSLPTSKGGTMALLSDISPVVNEALQTLDSSIAATTGQAISAITITDGKITGSSKISVGEANLVTDVQINGTSILSSKVANLVTNTAYNSSTNKIATMSDISDTKVTNTLATTTKYYVTGTTSSTTNTGTQSFDSGIYATTTAGQLNATTYLVNEKTRLEYNSTTNSLDFIFI